MIVGGHLLLPYILYTPYQTLHIRRQLRDRAAQLQFRRLCGSSPACEPKGSKSKVIVPFFEFDLMTNLPESIVDFV